MYKMIKRFFDIFLCTIALIVLSPLFVITAILIKVSSPGPVLYRSLRGGLYGKPFKFYKFRSMHLTDHDKGLFQADPERLFPFGKLIRRLKIDELPQLINVIRGDMSIVGPRPMTLEGVKKFYSGKYRSIRNVKPGLTSAASLFDYTVGDNYHDEIAYEKEVLPIKKEMELYYVKNRSLAYDTKLVLRTVFIIIQVLIGKKTFDKQEEYDYCKNELERH